MKVLSVIKNAQKKIGLATLSLPLLFSASACTEQERNQVIGVAAIVAGAAIVASASSGSSGRDRDRGRYVCRSGYRQVCESYYDYWGHHRTRCRQVYDSCAHRTWQPHSNFALAMAGSNNLDLSGLTQGVSAAGWAETFHMSMDASEQLIAAFESTRTGDSSALVSMGLSERDLNRIARLQMPSQKSIDGLARSLDQRADFTQHMLRQLLDEASKQRPAIEAAQAMGISILN